VRKFRALDRFSAIDLQGDFMAKANLPGNTPVAVIGSKQEQILKQGVICA